jgi:hypothetical protein
LKTAERWLFDISTLFHTIEVQAAKTRVRIPMGAPPRSHKNSFSVKTISGAIKKGLRY